MYICFYDTRKANRMAERTTDGSRRTTTTSKNDPAVLTQISKREQPASKFPAQLFPVQSEIQKLENDLDAFNERIAELENEGHRGHALEVLKANAIDLARMIDELRSLLIES
jgi:septal ring factor EnvC (AmiA/AmiB activator)